MTVMGKMSGKRDSFGNSRQGNNSQRNGSQESGSQRSGRQRNSNQESNDQGNNSSRNGGQESNDQGNNSPRNDGQESNDQGNNSQKNSSQENDDKKIEKEKHRDERIEQTGQVSLDENAKMENIHLISIIGEIEGHENLSNNSKTTKYEHILPSLAAIEDSKEIQGVLVLLNTMGGDVEAGLAIAEMLASLSKPTVSLVLGGSHSIGVPIAVSTDYSYIVPTGTMVIHPVRMSGMVIGVPQTFEYFKLIQDRITGFVCRHCSINKSTLEQLMTETGILTKDVGTILVGEEAVKYGIIDEVGGIDKAIAKLHSMISQ